MFSKALFAQLLLFVVLVLGLAACVPVTPAAPGAPAQPTTQASSSAAVPAAGGTLSLQLPGDWDSLDPALMKNSNGYQMAFLLYDRLTWLDGQGKPIPAVAKSWTQTADGAVLTLRDDKMTYADGTELTATTVANSLKRLADPATKAPYAYRTFGRSTVDITADDKARTVTIRLGQAYSDLILGLAMPWASLVSPAGLANPASMTTGAAGSGPFKLDKAVRGDTYTLTARPEYKWGPSGMTTSQAGYPATLSVRVVENQTTGANMLLSGELNIGRVTGQDTARVAANTALYQTQEKAFGTEWVLMNQDTGLPGADPAVRTAVMMAVDRAAWNKAETFGQGEVANSVIMPAVDCYEPQTASLIKYDVEGAKTVLKEAGYAPGADGKLAKGGKMLTLRIRGYTAQGSGPEYLLSAVEAIGIKGDLKVVDFNAYNDVMFSTGDWDLLVFPFGPPMPSPSTILPFLTGAAPKAGTNLAHLNNDEFNKASASALAAGTPADRCKYWSQAQLALLKNHDLLPVLAQTALWFGNGAEFKLFVTYLVVDPYTLKRTK